MLLLVLAALAFFLAAMLGGPALSAAAGPAAAGSSSVAGAWMALGGLFGAVSLTGAATSGGQAGAGSSGPAPPAGKGAALGAGRAGARAARRLSFGDSDDAASEGRGEPEPHPGPSRRADADVDGTGDPVPEAAGSGSSASLGDDPSAAGGDADGAATGEEGAGGEAASLAARADELHRGERWREELSLLEAGDASDPEVLWRTARARMAVAAARVAAGLGMDEARAEYRRALGEAEEASSASPGCAGALVWSSILVVKAADGFSETVKGALRIRDRAAAAAAADPRHPVPRFVLGAFCLRGAGLSWVERQTVSMLFGGDMSATFPEADEHLAAAVRLWDEGAAEGASWAAYLPGAPWRSVLVSAATARVRAAEATGTGMAAAKAQARELLRRARSGPAATADESAETDKDLDAAAALAS